MRRARKTPLSGNASLSEWRFPLSECHWPSGGLTARFARAPAEHDGKTAFKLLVAFSEGIKIGFRTFRDQSLSVSGGSVKSAKRVEGRRDLWEVTVKPGSLGDVTVTLEGGRACGADGAVCTGDGRALSATISTTVLGPAALSVADARVREADNRLMLRVALRF